LAEKSDKRIKKSDKRINGHFLDLRVELNELAHILVSITKISCTVKAQNGVDGGLLSINLYSTPLLPQKKINTFRSDDISSNLPPPQAMP